MILASETFIDRLPPSSMKEDEAKKILYVEDNPDECELVRAVLEGYDVICVTSIAAARLLLGAVRFTLIITDEHLPDGSGLGLCRWLSRSGHDTPIIVVSGDSYLRPAEALEVGARAFLGKGRPNYVENLYSFTEQFASAAKAKS